MTISRLIGWALFCWALAMLNPIIGITVFVIVLCRSSKRKEERRHAARIKANADYANIFRKA